LKVRDGVDPTDNLLLLWMSRDDDTDADWPTSTVVSTGSLMSVTWSVTSEGTIDMDHGIVPTAVFIVSYRSIGTSSSLTFYTANTYNNDDNNYYSHTATIYYYY